LPVRNRLGQGGVMGFLIGIAMLVVLLSHLIGAWVGANFS